MATLERAANEAVRLAAQRSEKARYIRAGLKEAGYSEELADLADFLRGDRNALELDTFEPGGRQAAEWFVKLLAEQQANIRFLTRFKAWRN